MSYYVTSGQVTSRHIILCRVMSHHVTTRRDMSCRFVLLLCATPVVRRRLVFCRVVLSHTMSYDMSCHYLLMEEAGKSLVIYTVNMIYICG